MFWNTFVAKIKECQNFNQVCELQENVIEYRVVLKKSKRHGLQN